jgi:hypothetical protein
MIPAVSMNIHETHETYTQPPHIKRGEGEGKGEGNLSLSLSLSLLTPLTVF